MKMKSTLLLFFSLFVFLDIAFAQQFYYSDKKKIILSEDTSTLVIKVKDNIALKSFLKELPAQIFERYDTTHTVGVIEAKLKTDVNRLNVLRQLRKNGNILYSWHSLKSKRSVLLPTGEIVLSISKGFSVNEVLKKLNINDDVKIKKIDEYGVVTLSVVDESKLFYYANYLYDSKMVDWCHPNFWAEVKHNTIDPLYTSQWYLNNTGQYFGTPGIDIAIEGAWAITQGSSSVRVAVIDDGVENHEDISGRVLSGYTPKNATGFGAPTSSGRHGQACAGIIAATKDNSIGIAGIAPNCLIIPVNMFHGGETAADIASAINWAWNYGQADVLSNSWSMNLPSDMVINAINSARTSGRGGKGSVVVFSSANDFSTVAFPANVDGVITVGAIDNNGGLHGYSNTGPSMDLVAPSGSAHFGSLALNNPLDGIRTTDRMGTNGYDLDNYVSFNGTSAACPQVSGVAALMLSANPNLTEAQVRNILQTTAVDMGATGFDNTFGFGRLNACAAVFQALGTTLSISGPSSLCDEATYAISNLPAGASVTWSIVGYCASVSNTTPSGNQATIVRDDYGIFKVRAVIVTDCGNVTVESGDIHAGMPYLIVSTEVYCEDGCVGGGDFFCAEPGPYSYYNNLFTYQLNATPAYPLTLHYMILDDQANIFHQGSKTITSATGYQYLPQTIPVGFYNLEVWVSGGGCNEATEWFERSIESKSCNSSSRMVAYPNPSNTEIKIAYKTDEKTKSVEINPVQLNDFSVKLLDKSGKVLKQGKTTTNQKNIVLKVADVPNGIYYLHIFEGKNVSKQQIVIFH